MVDVRILEKPLYALLLGVGDEHLPKMIVTDQPDELHHALIVKLVEDVVKQQDRLVSDLLVVVLELGQTDGDHERLLLALRSEFLQGMTVQKELKVVFMDAHIGVAGIGVLLQILLQKLVQWLLVQLGIIDDLDLFLGSGNNFVVMLENRFEFLEEQPSFVVDVTGADT